MRYRIDSKSIDAWQDLSAPDLSADAGIPFWKNYAEIDAWTRLNKMALKQI